eukprot:TRINITY_DN13659_c0_g1_i1.p1 TRINITY_DN13659_c0_g1~~TRINITY_DN13659_c0_g1_i1.p1  ORF type:complete len:357 (-),score=64.43 TRINITY_DN13659_c0_g1_i1:80-1150(-)
MFPSNQSYQPYDNQGAFHVPQEGPPPGHDLAQMRGPSASQSEAEQVLSAVPTHVSSRFTGKRKALLIGINYFRTRAELKGCINDVKNVKTFLLKNGFVDSPTTMVMLTDDNPSRQPTRKNIEAACQWLVSDAVPGDSLFVHYSGHGGQQADEDGDEADGYDETILPLDFEKSGMITDDELHELIVRPLKKGVQMTCIFDSCHSGSVLDLPFMYKSSGQYHDNGWDKQLLTRTIMDAGLKILKGDRAGGIMGLAKGLYGGYKAKNSGSKNKTAKASEADVLMIAGCRDDQTSADASISGQATGAMSYSFIMTMTQNPHPTYVGLLNSMRDILYEKKFAQIPQLSTSHEMDPNTQFSI